MLLASALGPRASWAPTDDRWYTQGDVQAWLDRHSTLLIDGESMYRCGTVLAAVRFLSEAWAMCPPQTMLKTPRGRRDDPQHYTQVVLRAPNVYQSGFRWRAVNMTRTATWGNSANMMLGGPRSFVSELRPMHPRCTEVVDQRADGSLIYRYRPALSEVERRMWGMKERILDQSSVLHFRHSLSDDGLSGMKISSLMRTAVSVALAAEQHAILSLTKGQRLSGLLVPPATLTDEVRNKVVAAFNEAFGGRSSGTVAVMPTGFDFKQLSANNREGQFVELNDQQVGSLLRFLGVPGVVVGYMGDKTATYASAKEFFEAGGIKHCVLPWLRNYEEQIDHDLVLEGDTHFVRFNLDVLSRANTKDRFEALFKACGRPWLSGNEVREIEDLNPDPDPSMDKVLLPGNMGTGEPEPEPPDDPAPPLPPPPPPPPPDDEGDAAASPLSIAKAELIIRDAATRCVRREVAAIRGSNGGMGAALKLARDGKRWRAWVAEFYEKHASYVMEALRVPEDVARAYCEAQAAALIEKGAPSAERWEIEVAPRLAALALEV